MGNFFTRIANYRFAIIEFVRIRQENVFVKINQGMLRGRSFASALDQSRYYGFLGIPYAKPPVGELRFRPPEPAESWSGVYNATYERNICIQPMIMWNKVKLCKGSEDCLYINVYTPQNPCEIVKLKPVMVYVHGGGFCFGSGSRKLYGPDYLITRDVIIVTFNYRVHVLGFLNLGLPECPGNVGLKDQVEAFRWVKQNIGSFGGDSENITIFGESAGGSSVHYHLLSPLSKGLFHRAIIESGSANCPWGIVYNPDEQAMDIGRRCGYTGNDRKELLSYLITVPEKTITLAFVDMMNFYRKVYPARFVNVAPSLEAIKEGAFLPDWPMNLAKTATPIPTIFGVNNNEGMLVYMNAVSELTINELRKDFSIFLRHNFRIDPARISEMSAIVKNLYFGNQEVGRDTASGLVNLYSDLIFFYGYESIEFLINSDVPPYIYEFTYDGQLNFATKLINFFKRIQIKGAAHGEELSYLFYPQIIPMFPTLTEESLRKIHEMTLMWTNFAKTGNPSGIVEWKPSTPKDPCYLQIDQESRLVKGKVYQERLQTLKNVLKSAIDPDAKPYDIYEFLYLIHMYGL